MIRAQQPENLRFATAQPAPNRARQRAHVPAPPILTNVRGLPLRHLVRMLSEWDQLRRTGCAIERVEAVRQMQRITDAIATAL
jgi:hypothetical protein